MKKVKYMSSILFITIILIFIGDMYVWNIDSFETEYLSTTMYQPAGISQTEMLADIEEAANQNQCKVFAVSRNIKTVYSEIVSIYAMEGIETVLSKKSSIHSGSYRSIFLGDVTVNIKEFRQIPDVSSIETYYIVGNLEDARTMKSGLVDVYGGNFPKEGYTYFHAARNIICVWTIGLFFLLLLTIFEITLLKKEMIVRFIYGENLLGIIMKQIVCDLCFYVCYFSLAFCILKFHFHVQVNYLAQVSVFCMLVFGLLHTLLFLSMLFTNYKHALSRGKSNQVVLNVSYIFKTVTIVVVTVIMSVCVEMISDSITYWKQGSFFEARSKLSYISVSADDNTLETTEKLMLSLLEKKSKEGKTILQVYLDDGMFSGQPCILCNQGSLEYLKEKIPDIREYDFSNKFYFIVPDKNSSGSVQDLEFLSNMYIGENLNYEIMQYKKSDEIIGIANQGKVKSKFYRNPLIILDLSGTCKYFNGIYISQACMFDIGEAEWQQYMDDTQVYENTSFITNAYEYYSYSLKNYHRLLLLGAIVLILLFIMELVIIKTTLHYECTIHSMELAIRTTVGDTVFMKYRKMYLTTFISIFCSACVCFIISIIFKLAAPFYILIGYLLVLGMDMVMMAHSIRYMEKANIQKILKGGML